jgi:hypothetical protein
MAKTMREELTDQTLAAILGDMPKRIKDGASGAAERGKFAYSISMNDDDFYKSFGAITSERWDKLRRDYTQGADIVQALLSLNEDILKALRRATGLDIEMEKRPASNFYASGKMLHIGWPI